MKNFIVGAQLYSVRSLAQNAEDLKKTLASLKEMGYNTCQLSGQSRDIPDEVVADILAETGMKAVVTHNYMQDFEEGFDALVARQRNRREAARQRPDVRLSQPCLRVLPS